MADDLVRVNRRGRRAMRSGKMTPMQELTMEVLIRTGETTQGHLMHLCSDILGHYGNPEGALEALRNGEVEFTRLN